MTEDMPVAVGECRCCDQPIEHDGRGWFDTIGYGCAGRGESGDVLPHIPRWFTTDESWVRWYTHSHDA